MLWGSFAIGVSGLLWIIPGLNVLSAIMAIAGIVLIVSRLGYLRAIAASLAGLIIVLFVGSITLGQLYGAVNTGAFLSLVVGPGLAMGSASRHFSSPSKTIWLGLIPVTLIFTALMFFYSDIMADLPGITRRFNDSMIIAIEQSPQLSRAISEQFGPDPGALDRFIEYMDKRIVLFFKLLPGTLVIGFLAIIMLGLAAAGTLASRLKLMIPRFPPFHLWRASDWWLLPTVAGLILAIFAKDELWPYVGGNILIVTGNIYSLVGLAVFQAWLRRLSIPIFVRVILYVIMILMSVFSLVFLAVLGLADGRFNFRRENLDSDGMNIE